MLIEKNTPRKLKGSKERVYGTDQTDWATVWAAYAKRWPTVR